MHVVHTFPTAWVPNKQFNRDSRGALSSRKESESQHHGCRQGRADPLLAHLPAALREKTFPASQEAFCKVRVKPKEHFKSESDFKESCWETCTCSFSYSLAMFDCLSLNYSFSQISTTNPLMDLKQKSIQPANTESKTIIFHEEDFDVS